MRTEPPRGERTGCHICTAGCGGGGAPTGTVGAAGRGGVTRGAVTTLVLVDTTVAVCVEASTCAGCGGGGGGLDARGGAADAAAELTFALGVEDGWQLEAGWQLAVAGADVAEADRPQDGEMPELAEQAGGAEASLSAAEAGGAPLGACGTGKLT